MNQETGGTGKPQGEAPQTHLPTNLSTAPSQFSNPYSFVHPIPAGCEPIKMAVLAVVSVWLSMYCLTTASGFCDSGNTFLPLPPHSVTGEMGVTNELPWIHRGNRAARWRVYLVVVPG